MIVVGYQGIDKSSLANTIYFDVVDLENSNFFVEGKRPENWYIIYSQIALSLSRQDKWVCISSHKVVRDYLASIPDCGELLVIVHPSLELKDEWTKKLKDRYEQTGLEKDYKAWKNAECDYENNISDLIAQPGFGHIQINDMDYSLVKLLADFEQEERQKENA